LDAIIKIQNHKIHR